MKNENAHTGDDLVSALHALGVNFVMGGVSDSVTLYSHPSRLIAELAQNHDARLRLSLIPLFLEHPEYASWVQTAARNLGASARLTLQCYYSAAVWLARKAQPAIHLPDYFSEELNISPVDDPDSNLQELARRHRELSGSLTNWLGTYQHAEQVWRRGLAYRKE